MFKDIFQREDEWKRRVIGAAGLLSLLPLMYILLVNFSHKTTPEDIERSIASSSVLQHLDGLCNSLPHPRDFQLVEKRNFSKSDYRDVGYFYRSAEKFESVQKFYSEWASTNGWQTDKERPDIACCRFEASNDLIIISPVEDQRYADYSINCLKKN